ncbi:ABC transporter permease [Streptosporangium sp. 'caverna']|uniref:ABC transporter permease n=1 Tax=Streptosporangium sp. 'caverna' TaxID=2202249 RepID=UPI001EF8DC32|nr:ABC transporter permease [Streptosporangium sp. 'caverna']
MDDRRWRRRHGAQKDRRTAAGLWKAFRHSPFFAATALVLILPIAAGSFAGFYTYAFADPTPRSVPVALVGARDTAHSEAFVAGMEKALGARLVVRRFDTYRQALTAVEEQQVFAVLDARPDGFELTVSGASGASVAQALTQAAPREAAGAGIAVSVRDAKPLQRGDPRGLALFYITLAAVIIGFAGANQLSVNATGLNAGERIAFTGAYALLGAFVVIAVVDWTLHAITLPFPRSWLILALTMFVSGMVFTMFNTLLGRWAIAPTWGLMVVLGSPSSGGFVSWPLLPSALGLLGQWLPPGASISAQHTAVYFPGHQHVMPYLVLGAWALLSCTVFLLWRHRHPAGRPGPEPARRPRIRPLPPGRGQ